MHPIGQKVHTVSGLRQRFEEAITFMLEDCAARGEEPERPASGNLMLRVPPEVHHAAIAAAHAAGTSLNQWATNVLASAARQ